MMMGGSLEDEKTHILKPGIYQHYKGQRYRVFGIAHHTETLEQVVVYQALYGEYGLWVRPLAMFCETVVNPQGEVTSRFLFIHE